MADIAKKRVLARQARHSRIRKKINGSSERPRLCVRRSLKNMVAQIVDDTTGVSILQIGTHSKDFKEKYGELNKSEQSNTKQTIQEEDKLIKSQRTNEVIHGPKVHLNGSRINHRSDQ